MSKEDYLEEIYRLQRNNNRSAKISEIAKALSVSKPSVSQMVRTLSKEELIEFEKYGDVSLTKKGAEKACSIMRKHQLLEVFFKSILKLKGKFHSEAHKVEHTLSDEATDKLDKLLKKPTTCPDGNPIPKKSAKIFKLNEIPEKSEVVVLFSATKKDQCAQTLNSLGLVPKTKIKVLRKIKNGPIIVRVKGSEIALGQGICCKIFVEKK